MKKINFLDLELQQNKIKNYLDVNLKKVLNHSNYIMGPEVKRLEKALEVYTEAKYCITCASGTDALILSLLAYGIGKGHHVICPSFTFPATAEAILITGAKPIFIDVGKKTFNLCYQQLEKILHNKKLDIKAVIAVDLFGLPANYKKLKAISKKYNIKIIADAAQSFGASLDNKRVGNLTSITCTSFFPAKPLGCYGDGGAIFTNNKLLKDKLVSLRAHGKSTSKYKISKIGLNSRLDTIQASFLSAKLPYLKEFTFKRQEIANTYNANIDNKYLTKPKVLDFTKPVWHLYILKSKHRDLLKSYLSEKGISSVINYIRSLPENEAFEYLKTPIQKYTNSQANAKEVLSIPLFPEMKKEEIDYVIFSLNKFKP